MTGWADLQLAQELVAEVLGKAGLERLGLVCTFWILADRLAAQRRSRPNLQHDLANDDRPGLRGILRPLVCALHDQPMRPVH